MTTAMDLLSDQGFRLDGRRPGELRRIDCKMGVFQQADGSAYVAQGNTKVLAAVYGPHEIRGGRSKMLHDQALINCQCSIATFSTTERKRRPRGDRKTTEMTMHLKQVVSAIVEVDKYPRSQIDVFVEVLQSDGGVFSACVNAATLSLIDAGVPLKDYVVACTAAMSGTDTPLVDASYSEESSRTAEIEVAVMPQTNNIVLLEMAARVHVDHLEKLVDTAVKGAKEIRMILDRTVRENATKMAVSLNMGGE